MGPNGEIIMDYSIYDAKEAGFNKVVFIIWKDIFKEFQEIIGDRIRNQIDVEYVFQELEDLPEGLKYRKEEKKHGGQDKRSYVVRILWKNHLWLSMQMIIMGKKHLWNYIIFWYPEKIWEESLHWEWWIYFKEYIERQWCCNGRC